MEVKDFYQEEVVLLVARPLLERLYGPETAKLVSRVEQSGLAPLADCPFLLNRPQDIAGRVGRNLLAQAGVIPKIAVESSNTAICGIISPTDFCVQGHVDNVLGDLTQCLLHAVGGRLIFVGRELDTLFERLYEDNVSGKIDDARFAKMSKRYEEEQGELAKKIKSLRLEIQKTEGQQMDVDEFLSMVRRYTNATTVTRRMVSELIERIEVYPAEKRMGSKPNGSRFSITALGPLRCRIAGRYLTWTLFCRQERA